MEGRGSLGDADCNRGLRECHGCVLCRLAAQAEDVKKRADYVAQLRRVGKARRCAAGRCC